MQRGGNAALGYCRRWNCRNRLDVAPSVNAAHFVLGLGSFESVGSRPLQTAAAEFAVCAIHPQRPLDVGQNHAEQSNKKAGIRSGGISFVYHRPQLHRVRPGV